MKLTKKLDNNVLTVAVEGRLDTNTSPELDEMLTAERDSADKLVLDFSTLDYISSAGLRVLLSNHKAMSAKGGMVVTGVSPVVAEIFEITGFSDILNIE